MTTFNVQHVADYGSTPLRNQNRRAKAEEDFAHAQAIVAGGLEAARDYARAWYETYSPPRWMNGTEPQRLAMLANHANGALACAKAIVADGRAHYETTIDGERRLIVCTLIPDGSAGAVGYDLWS